MDKIKRVFSIIILFSLFFLMPVSAKEINEFNAVSDDNVSFKDTVIGESAIAGNNVDFGGKIDGIGFIAGSTVDLKGDIEYGFVAGASVKVSGNIEKSLYIAGSSIDFLKGSNIGRDVFAFGDSINMNGTFARDVNMYSNSVVIGEGAIINGNLSLEASSITINDGATIKGTLKYNEDATVSISKKANVSKTETFKSEVDKKVDTNSLLTSTLNMVIVFLVITILLSKVVDRTYEDTMNKSVKNWFKDMGIGFITLVCLPLICLFLLVSNIGTSLGFIMGAIYAICIYLSFVLSGYVLGNLLIGKIMKLNANKYLAGIIGIIVLKLIGLIPVFGSLVYFISLILGLGVIYKLIVKSDNDKPVKTAKAKVIKK